MILRVQDSVGRGPYRPGLSHRWADPNGPDNPPWWIEIGETMEAAHGRMTDLTMHYGCGFDTMDQFHAWFNPRDLRNLDRLGFKLVKIDPDVIVARTPSQVVFGARKHFAAAAPRVSLISSLARAA